MKVMRNSRTKVEEQVLNSNQNGHRLKAVFHLIVVAVSFVRNLRVRNQLSVQYAEADRVLQSYCSSSMFNVPIKIFLCKV